MARQEFNEVKILIVKSNIICIINEFGAERCCCYFSRSHYPRRPRLVRGVNGKVIAYFIRNEQVYTLRIGFEVQPTLFLLLYIFFQQIHSSKFKRFSFNCYIFKQIRIDDGNEIKPIKCILLKLPSYFAVPAFSIRGNLNPFLLMYTYALRLLSIWKCFNQPLQWKSSNERKCL